MFILRHHAHHIQRPPKRILPLRRRLLDGRGRRRRHLQSLRLRAILQVWVRRRLAPSATSSRHHQGHGQTALFLHRPHRHGHPERPRQENHPERHLSVHHGAISLLQGEQARLAKLHKTQSQFERVLCESAERRQETGQGQLLDPGPRLLQHVRQRVVLEASQALQEEGRPEGKGGSHQKATTPIRLSDTPPQARGETLGGHQEQARVQTETRTQHGTEPVHECEVQRSEVDDRPSGARTGHAAGHGPDSGGIHRGQSDNEPRPSFGVLEPQAVVRGDVLVLPDHSSIHRRRGYPQIQPVVQPGNVARIGDDRQRLPGHNFRQ